MKKFFEAAPHTLVDAMSVTAIQGRLVNSKDQYGDTATGTITITTVGGNVLVQSSNVPVDLDRIREAVEQMAVLPQPFATGATIVTNLPPDATAPVAE